MKGTKRWLFLVICCFAFAGMLLCSQNVYAGNRSLNEAEQKTLRQGKYTAATETISNQQNRIQQSSAITKKECRQLAKKKVKNAKITSIYKKYDDGIKVYKVNMHNNKKEYTLKYHAKTGTLLEYEWELVNMPNRNRR